jgi:hypothetical protein
MDTPKLNRLRKLIEELSAIEADEFARNMSNYDPVVSKIMAGIWLCSCICDEGAVIEAFYAPDSTKDEITERFIKCPAFERTFGNLIMKERRQKNKKIQFKVTRGF